MAHMSRRDCIQGTMAALAASAAVPPAEAAAGTPMRQARGANRRGMQLAELFLPGEDHKIALAAQIGITHAIVTVSRALGAAPRTSYAEVLRQIGGEFAAAGMVFAGVEKYTGQGDPFRIDF